MSANTVTFDSNEVDVAATASPISASSQALCTEGELHAWYRAKRPQCTISSIRRGDNPVVVWLWWFTDENNCIVNIKTKATLKYALYLPLSNGMYKNRGRSAKSNSTSTFLAMCAACDPLNLSVAIHVPLGFCLSFAHYRDTQSIYQPSWIISHFVNRTINYYISKVDNCCVVLTVLTIKTWGVKNDRVHPKTVISP